MVSIVGTAIWTVLERCGRSSGGFPLDAGNGVVRLLCARGYIKALGPGSNGATNATRYGLTPLGREAVRIYPTRTPPAVRRRRRTAIR
jgi:hypothetical protein